MNASPPLCRRQAEPKTLPWEQVPASRPGVKLCSCAGAGAGAGGGGGEGGVPTK